MYAKLCDIEVLPSYIKEVAVGDILTVQALITNPLDWHHFYEKVSTIKIGDRTDFTVITPEGERVVGFGNIEEVDKRSEEHTSELQSRQYLVCRLLLEKKKNK